MTTSPPKPAESITELIVECRRRAGKDKSWLAIMQRGMADELERVHQTEQERLRREVEALQTERMTSYDVEEWVRIADVRAILGRGK